MNVAAFAHINDHCFARILEAIHRHGLCLTQFGPVIIHRLRLLVTEISKLNPIKREITLPPFVAPILDHERKHVTVSLCPAAVTLALIPNDSLDAVPDERLEHAVIKVTGPMLAGQRVTWIARTLRHRLAGLACIRGGGLPFL